MTMGRISRGALLAALLVAGAGQAQSPGSAEYYIKYGKEYAAAGNADMAALYFREGVQMYPQNAQMHLYLAQVLAAGGDKAKALAEFEAALKLDPSLRDKARKAMDYYQVSAAQAAAEDDGLLIPRTANAPIKIGDPIEVKDHASGQWFAGTVTEVTDISDDGSKLVYKVRYRNQVSETENRFYPGSWRAPTGRVEQAGGTSGGKPGGALAYGGYQCTQDYFTGAVGSYRRQSDQKGTLSLKAGGSYSFRGSAGRYSYDAASGAIKWLSGYLAADSNTSRFRRNVRTSQIDIAFHTASGDLDWSCGHNL
jgi:tetratricopeptide (TPR) repeat protein